MSTKMDSRIRLADDVGVMVGREIRRALDFQPSQPRKYRLVNVRGLGLRVHEDDAQLPAIQKTPMFRWDVEDTVVGDGLKFDRVHGYG